ncbi:MAG: hypothetical protein CL843_00730 [Crocinitomicaceae bacterium]|nr:hypothetical protein [Crocinitomicaceae bacterium]
MDVFLQDCKIMFKLKNRSDIIQDECIKKLYALHLRLLFCILDNIVCLIRNSAITEIKKALLERKYPTPKPILA